MTIADLILSRLSTWRNARLPLVLGLCGAQGSGKSTVAAALAADLAAEGLAVATLSLDDLYLGRAPRSRLAAEVHPLLATRGPPGTHDVRLGMDVLQRLRRGTGASLPRFDKGSDEPFPVADWPATAGCDVVIFEGWCVGAQPQTSAALARPVNALERDEDANGTWRTYVNTRVGGDYQALFGLVDRLVLLAAPGFEMVERWRREQEHRLLATHQVRPPAAMTDAEIARFVQHYERLTRHILTEMPTRADLCIGLGPDREVLSVSG